MESMKMRNRRKEYQKARAIASFDLPNRPEVEDHNLTHVPFRSGCIHCIRGTRRRSACKGGTMGKRSRQSNDYMYSPKKVNAEESERSRKRKHDVGQPIMVGVNRKIGGIHAHQLKYNGCGDPWMATRIAADTEELRYGGSRVVQKTHWQLLTLLRQVVVTR